MTAEKAIKCALERVKENIENKALTTPEDVLSFLRGYLAKEIKKAEKQS